MGENGEWSLNVTVKDINKPLQTETPLGTDDAVEVLNSEQSVIMDYLIQILHVSLSILGLVTNIINVYGFLNIGVKESVTLILLSLSCSDLIFSCTQVIKSVAIVIEFLETESRSLISSVHPFAILIFSGNLGILCYSVTMLITTYLAVTRSMCVAMPLHFKTTFTIKRTLYALTIFALIPYVTYLPVFAEMSTVIRLDPAHNVSRPVLWMSKKRAERRKIAYFILFVVLPMICQILIVVSVISLIAGLKSTSNFRKSMNSNYAQGSPKKTDIKTISSKNTDPPETSQKQSSTSGELTGKELQVARQVILVCTVFFVTNLPAMGVALTQLAEKEFNMGKRFHNIYILSNHMGNISMLINSCTTMFIYLRFNTAFRKTLSRTLKPS